MGKYFIRVIEMAYDVSALLKTVAMLSQFNTDSETASTVYVTGVSSRISLGDIYRGLTEYFDRQTPGTSVERIVHTSSELNEPTVDIRINFNRAVDKTVLETTVHHVLEKSTHPSDKPFKRSDIHMIFEE